MSDIKAGSVALVRTTGEPVFVLAVRKEVDAATLNNVPELSGLVADIRRMNGGANGTFYDNTSLYVEELETEDAAVSRKVSEAQEMKARFGFGKPPAFTSDVAASS